MALESVVTPPGPEANRPPVYDSANRLPAAVEELIELARYRDLITQLARRDILTRYKRSALGVGWTMLTPLGMMLVLMLAFADLFESRQTSATYLFTGLIVWTFFAQATTAAMRQLVHGGVLLHRIYVPRTVFCVSAVGTGLVNLVLSFVPLAFVMVVVGAPFHPTMVFLPIAIAAVVIFTLGVSLLISTLAVYFADVLEMYQVALLAWMYLTPIIYPETIVPASYRWLMFNLNPMYHFVALFRIPLADGVWPSAARVGIAAVIALGALLIGWLAFTSRADELAYRV